MIAEGIEQGRFPALKHFIIEQDTLNSVKEAGLEGVCQRLHVAIGWKTRPLWRQPSQMQCTATNYFLS
jgi:hypothetical protein